LQSAVIAEELGRTGLSVYPDFLSADELALVRADLLTIHEGGAFYRAGTGKGEQQRVQDKVRKDEIFWFDRALPDSSGSAARSLLWRKLDDLKQAMNRSLYLGLAEFEGHYAVYPEGGFYHRHVDCFNHDNTRVVSLILYLNSDWRPEHGGKLRSHDRVDPARHIDVAPVGGTLVCFLSRETEHEVLESHQPRLSFTGWFPSR
jgi:SM-20-related protein